VRRELSPGPWIAAIVVIIIVASAYWWFSSPVQPEPEVVEPAAVDDGVVVTPPSTEEETAVTPPATDDSTVVNLPVQEPAAEPVVEVEPEPEPPVDDGQLHMLVTYSGDCWTEITDASGRRLLFALGKDGRTVELSGAEPFNVLFGNPGNVSLRVNGQDYELPATNRPDRPMRLTVSGS
jgi:cytoskeleton protein RodZ